MKQGNTKGELKLGKDSGRVKAFVRVRPFSKEETQRREELCLKITTETAQICFADKAKCDKVFQFDHVFPPYKTNDDVSNYLCKPLVNAALSGFNGTLMAYGQTGTGKTHTLMASDGITTNVINRCFDRILQDKEKEYKIKVSYLQIYQEKIYDLLNASNKIELCLRESPKTGVYVENLTEYVVRTPGEVQTLIATGKRRLVFAETKMNRTSSRSHAVFQMTIERTLKKDKREMKQENGKDMENRLPGCKAPCENLAEETAEDSYTLDVTELDNDVLVRGKIHLCDLAGSERLKKTQASGERLMEAQHINSSLLELGNVIQALADDKKTHIPFRNSVLTRLLQESLGGNCKTSLVVCVSPSSKDISETKSTLYFGSRAMKITNTAYINMEVDFKSLSDTLLVQLQQKEEEIAKLKESNEAGVLKAREEMMSLFEQTSKESEKIIKHQRKLYESEVKALEDRLAILTEETSSRDLIIKECKVQLNKNKNERLKEEHQAKLMLMAEALSMKILAAVECKSFEGCSKWAGQGRERHRLVLSLLQHCKCLVAFTRVYLRYQKGNLPENPARNTRIDIDGTLNKMATVSDVLCEDLAALHSPKLLEDPSQNELECLKDDLFQTKNELNEVLHQTFVAYGVVNEEEKQGLSVSSMETASPVLALCKVLVDKSMLSCIIAIEKLELKSKLRNLETKLKNAVHVHYESDVDVQDKDKLLHPETTAGCSSVTKAKPADSEDKILGFEFALSRIEKLLFDSRTTSNIKLPDQSAQCSCVVTGRVKDITTTVEDESLPPQSKGYVSPLLSPDEDFQAANIKRPQFSLNSVEETNGTVFSYSVPMYRSPEATFDLTSTPNMSLDAESELMSLVTENAEIREENMKLKSEIQDLRRMIQRKEDDISSDLERRTIEQYALRYPRVCRNGDSQRKHLLGHGRRNLRLHLDEYVSEPDKQAELATLTTKGSGRLVMESVCTQTEETSLGSSDKFVQVDIGEKALMLDQSGTSSSSNTATSDVGVLAMEDFVDDEASELLRGDVGFFLKEINVHDEIDDMTDILDQLIELDKGVYDLKDKMAGNRVSSKIRKREDLNEDRSCNTRPGNYKSECGKENSMGYSSGGLPDISSSQRRLIICNEITRATEEIGKLKRDKAEFASNLNSLRLENAKLYAALHGRYQGQWICGEPSWMKETDLFSHLSRKTNKIPNAMSPSRAPETSQEQTNANGMSGLMLSNVLHVYTPCMNVIPGQFHIPRNHCKDCNDMPLSLPEPFCDEYKGMNAMLSPRTQRDPAFTVIDNASLESGQHEDVRPNKTNSTTLCSCSDPTNVKSIGMIPNGNVEENSVGLKSCQVGRITRSSSNIEGKKSYDLECASTRKDESVESTTDIVAQAKQKDEECTALSYCSRGVSILPVNNEASKYSMNTLLDGNHRIECECICPHSSLDQGVENLNSTPMTVDQAMQLAACDELQCVSVSFASPYLPSTDPFVQQFENGAPVLSLLDNEESEPGRKNVPVGPLSINSVSDKEEIVFNRPWSIRDFFTRRRSERTKPDSLSVVLQ